MRHFVSAGLVSALLASSACTQPPAQVELRGSSSFARSSQSGGSSISYSSSARPSYSAPAPAYASSAPSYPVSQSTERSASVQSIGVNDLPPPAKSQDTSRGATNPWTNKPRAEAKAPQEKPVAKLDSIISNDEAHKPVKLITARESSASLMWPVNSHKVISAYGPKGAGKANDGINIASGEGEPVWAAGDGEIVYVGNELSGYGNMVIIKHPGSKTTSYAHLSRASVDKYDRVKQGDIIGYVGSTGNVKKPQLHFAVRDGKNPVDPKKYLSTNMAGL